MSVGASEFIAIAERILAAEDAEIGWRVAASRAYYGAFHCCRDLVDRQPAIPVNSTLPTHERVFQAIGGLALSFPGATELKKLTYKAKNIRDIRVHGDYDVANEFPRQRAEQAIAGAKEVLALHQKYCTAHGL